MKTTSTAPDGIERRTNGKLKLTSADYIKILFTIVIVVGCSATGWATLKGNVVALAKETDVSSKCNIVQDKRLDIVETKQNEILKNVTSIRLVQQDMTKLLYKIDGKLERNAHD